MSSPDLTLQTFGSWRALARDPEKTSKWLVRCVCGTLGSVEGSYLRNGRSKQCRNCRDAANKQFEGLKYDHTGQRFGRLTVLEHQGRGRWLCRCDCGVEKVVTGSALRSGNNVSCGCRNPARQSGEGHPRHRGNQIAYATAHKRVANQRGSASTHQCISCPEPATAWAYRGGSAQELTQVVEKDTLVRKAGSVLRYSPDPADYDPMCWTCHTRKDVLEARSRA